MISTMPSETESTAPNEIESEERLKVSPGIVNRLSIGLYRNFGLAVKELISNSYDADATEVKIRLDLKQNRFIIRDNGNGMTYKDLKNTYLRIGESKESGTKTPMGRTRIGQFGIGNLAVFPYCEEIHLITKKRGERTLVEAWIDAREFTREFLRGEKKTIEEIPIPVKRRKTDHPIDMGETILYLNGIKPHIMDWLRSKGKSTRRTTIDQLSGYGKFKWTLSQYLPLRYPEGRGKLESFFGSNHRGNFRVWLDGTELERNVVEKAQILEKGSETFGGVEVRYVIMSPLEPVRPQEARGLQLRLRNVAIGFPTDFDVIKIRGRVLGKLNYLTGEIHILKGLGNELLIDRDRFSYTEDYDRLAEFFRKKLTDWSNELERIASHDKKIYTALSGIPQEKKVIREMKKSGIVQIDRSRVRIPRPDQPKGKRGIYSQYAEKLNQVLEQTTEYTVRKRTAEIRQKESPVRIEPESKKITIIVSPEEREEQITVYGREYSVSYDSWDAAETLESVCRISNGRMVVYNRKHPVFKSGLDHETIKYLTLGGLLLLQSGIEDGDPARMLYDLITNLPRR